VREAWQNIALLYAPRRLSSKTDTESPGTVKTTVNVNAGFTMRGIGERRDDQDSSDN